MTVDERKTLISAIYTGDISVLSQRVTDNEPYAAIQIFNKDGTVKQSIMATPGDRNFSTGGSIRTAIHLPDNGR